MFHFKQFSIQQERAVMKVGTDGVLIGAWTPVSTNYQNILDVGAGTGLIALMLAQRCAEASVDAVEQDIPSCEDMEANFMASPWSNRLTAFRCSFQEFCCVTNNKYDLIVCNPPFFSNSLKNSSERKARARHNHTLPPEDLIDGVKQLLRPNGIFSLILPALDYEAFRLQAFRKGLFEYQKLNVRPTPNKPVKRVISVWGLQFPQFDIKEEELVIELSRHCYSEAYTNLTRNFYLNL